MIAERKLVGTLIEYLDEGHFRAGLVVGERERHLMVCDAQGRERLIPRDLMMIQHPDRRPSREAVGAAISSLEAERAALARDLDLNLLWEVVQEQGRSFGAPELAELFFGHRSLAGTSVVLEALLNDRLFFLRRHMEFVPRPRDQVERLRVQQDRIRSRSEEYRRTQALLRDVLNGSSATLPDSADKASVIKQLSGYLRNPFTRDRELTQMLSAIAPEIDPAELAFEILERLGECPGEPRFALIAGVRTAFGEDAIAEASQANPPPRPAIDAGLVMTIDDDDTVEIDDALSCEELPDGGLRVRVHIALVADFVSKGGPIDREAASRATTVYLPETTIRMIPEPVSIDRASLIESRERPVLTTDITISPDADLVSASIYPSQIRISRRLDYVEADRIIAGHGPDEVGQSLNLLLGAAMRLRERRKIAGAQLMHRREPKVTVRDDDIQVRVLDSDSPSRMLVAEFMVLSNFLAARFAAGNRIPIIYRVQPETRHDPLAQRPRLSLFPEHHAGIGLDYYAQLSSPIRRYADLVLQRQLLAALMGEESFAYTEEELLKVLADAEEAESSRRELERRAKRYWILRRLAQYPPDTAFMASVLRDGMSAELSDFAVRGTLRRAPELSDGTSVLVRITRADPLRGWLAFEYLSQVERSDGAEPVGR